MAGRRAASTNSCPGTGPPRKAPERQAARRRVSTRRLRLTPGWVFLNKRGEPRSDTGRTKRNLADSLGTPWRLSEAATLNRKQPHGLAGPPVCANVRGRSPTAKPKWHPKRHPAEMGAKRAPLLGD